MFYNCKALKGGKGTVYSDANANDITFAHPDGGTSNPGYFTDNILASYTVTFVDWDGRQISKQEIEHGKPAFEPIHPTRPGYTFTGWDLADFSSITSNMTITAQYADALYVVSVFVEGEGEVVTTNSKGKQIDPSVGVPYQTRLTFKAVPAEGWSFKEWNILGANYTEITLVVSMHMPLLATFVKNPATGVEELEINAQDNEQKPSPCKVLDPQSHRVYILMPDGTKYDTMGRKVK